MGWYLVITEEMRALGLSGNSLLVYALIYSFSQKKQGCFWGNADFVAEVCGISRRTAFNVLQRLTEDGFIQKKETFSASGAKTILYTALNPSEVECKNCTEGSAKIALGSAEIAPDSAKIAQSSAKFAPNNNNDKYNYNNNYNIYNTPQAFDFRKALEGIGVSAEVSEAWLRVRRAKRATNTKIAFDKIAREIQKSGRSADDCIRIAVENSWQGFCAEWLEKKSFARAENRKTSSFEASLRAIDAYTGTNLHDTHYGK